MAIETGDFFENTCKFTKAMIYCNQPKKGGDILSDLLIGYPRVYRFLLIVSYTLPLPALLVYTVFALLHFDLLTLVAGFFGTLIAGVFIFFPLFCIYYAALTFLHTLLDELFFPAFLKKKRKTNILISLFISLFWALSSWLTYEMLDYEYGWIPPIFMLMGIVVELIFQKTRISRKFAGIE